MAQCFRDLGEAGDAARYARRSLDMDGRYIRGRAFNLSLLATAHAAQGEPEQACAAGRQALDLTVRSISARSVRYLRDLVQRLRPRADVAAVREFTTRCGNACLSQQGMLGHDEDNSRAENAAAGDHRGRLVQRHPPDSAVLSPRVPRPAPLRAPGTGLAGSPRSRSSAAADRSFHAPRTQPVSSSTSRAAAAAGSSPSST